MSKVKKEDLSCCKFPEDQEGGHFVFSIMNEKRHVLDQLMKHWLEQRVKWSILNRPIKLLIENILNLESQQKTNQKK